MTRQLDLTKSSASPEGLMPQGREAGAIRRRSASSRKLARLRRGLNRWIAAAIAYRKRQARLSALYRLEGRGLNQARVYRGPIDGAIEKAAYFRRQRRLG